LLPNIITGTSLKPGLKCLGLQDEWHFSAHILLLAELVLTHPACWLFQTQHCENTLFAALAMLQPSEKFLSTEICPQASHSSAL